ncbi:MAG TPA: ABC transporter ATP-binding protein [Anaerolineaceae bacterium]|nr:ABC transporter ATP-binding protein [Anaerolineaceae bacterium]
MLVIKNLGKDYEGKPLLKGISFEVNQGETICLLGRSGSGKSTILRIIAGIEKPEAGDVFWDQQNLENIPVHKRKFGFMFQDYALFPHKNIYENVAFGLRMQKMDPDDIHEKVLENLEKVKLKELMHRQVADLSGGEQQRVALARALAPEPRLLMLDEPLGALDRTLKEELMVELRNLLHETNIPAIYVTHDQEEAFTIGDRLILLRDGKIIQNASPQEIYLQPQNTWVAEFLGLSNIVDGQVIETNPVRVKTEFGMIEISGIIPDTLRKNDPVRMLIRPEGLLIGESEVNTFEAFVLDSVFLGNEWRTKIKIGGQDLTFIIDKPLKINSNVIISFSSAAISILKEQK